MSLMEEAVVSQLATDAGVLALIGADDIHAVLAPQGAAPPHVIYQLISCPELEVAEYVRPRLQLTCWASTYAAAITLANAVRSAFFDKHLTVLGVHFRSWIDNVMDGDCIPELERFSRIVDVRLDYRNPS